MDITPTTMTAALVELGLTPDVELNALGPIYILSSQIHISTEAEGGWLLWLDSGEQCANHCFKFGPKDFGLLLATVSRLYFN
jgi:hypothetical protein